MMLTHPYPFISNDPDDLHCYQATVRMVWEGLFGETLSPQRADELTLFVAGAQTWPFAGMLALAERGATVSNVEDFDPEAFVSDPYTEILRQSGGDKELTDKIVSVADADEQKPLVRRCLDHPRISFVRSNPTMADLRQATTLPDTAVICNVNYRALVGREGYNGHFVLVEKAISDELTIQDPGLPPLKDHQVDADTFMKAWSADGGGWTNMIVISSPNNSEALPAN
jgi:hypothetical protein